MFITAFYSTFVKLVLFVLFLKFAFSFISTKEIEYAAIFSLIVGCFGTLRQVEVKRFLAYSSITHTGYLLMGDLSAAYVYLVTYLLASLMFFSVLINFQLNSKEPIYLTDLRFVGQLNSSLPRIILTVSLASMAGLPPFAGFYGKMSI
jgi:NADH-quinone oxidoreductase subunit N